jgi:protein SCO1/2
VTGRVCLALLFAAGTAWAEAQRPGALQDVGFDQRLGESLPADITLRDELGRPLPMSELLGRKPLVLALVYYDCPMLCTLTLNGLTGALAAIPFQVGREFDVITVSFDPRETPELAAEKKKSYLARYRRPDAEAGWRFLTGDEAALSRLTAAVGFRYAWDDETKQFAHPAGIVVVTPEGRIARYLYGIEYAPKDLRLALVEASQKRIGSPVDQLLLYCYRYDPMTGKYGAAIMNLVRGAAVLTLLALGSFVGLMVRRERVVARAARGQG